MPVICPRCCGVGVFVEPVDDDRAVLEWDCLYCGHVYYTDLTGNRMLSYCAPSYEEQCGENLRRKRISLGLSIQQLATKANLSRRYLTRIERGNARIGAKTITHLATAWGMHRDEAAMLLMKGIAA